MSEYAGTGDRQDDRRIAPHHEHEFEAAPGLPEALPTGERILWQGGPSWGALCLHVFHLRKLAVYFAAMMTLQALYLLGGPLAAIGPSLAFSTVAAGAALGLLALTAWLVSRTTLYTLTSRRVVMRIGIVLTITLNLPLRQLRGADLLVHADGHGDVSLALAGDKRIGWFHLWPHGRPWALRDPQPALRCIADAQAVGQRLLNAWQAANPGVATRVSPAAAASSDPRATAANNPIAAT
jgi:hypothetical protein